MTVNQETARLGRTSFTRSDWAWQEHANCRGEDLTLFFGTEGERPGDRTIREQKAKQVCAGCPVIGDCLEEAYREPRQHGVWGGMGPEERTAARKNVMRRRREKGAA